MTDEKIANRTAVALGNFDGMHVGHMAVLEGAKSFQKDGLVPVAVLFDEHSMKAITGIAPPMLMTVGERNEYIIKNGLKLETIIFNEIKNLSPEDFVEKILVEKLRAGAVCCGYNYRFGKDAAGSASSAKLQVKLILQAMLSAQLRFEALLKTEKQKRQTKCSATNSVFPHLLLTAIKEAEGSAFRR